MKHFKWLALIAAAVFAIGFVACTPHGVGPGDEAGIKYYTVTFDSDGGSAVEKQTVESGKTATKPADPAKASTASIEYTFAGWYSGDTAFDFATAITSDITLKAKWTEKAIPPANPGTYTVTIAGGIENGTVNTDKSTAAKGDTVTLTLSATDNYELETISVKDASNTEVTTTEVTKGSSYTFTMGESNVTVSATFKKKAATPTYIGTKAPTEAKAVGDIVFSDGSATPYSTDLTLSDAQKEAAVAVIYYAGSSAEDVLGVKTLGVGLKNTGTDSTLAWAKNPDTDITAIQCTPVGKNAATAKFSGDTDGSNNWQALCDAVSDEGTSGNYPAWEWVNAYATTTVNLTGDYANGWYLPTVAELSMLYRVKDTVNRALEKAGGTEIADEAYWSSSQYASDTGTAWDVWFDDGYLYFTVMYTSQPVGLYSSCFLTRERKRPIQQFNYLTPFPHLRGGKGARIFFAKKGQFPPREVAFFLRSLKKSHGCGSI